jgi:D-mannonate dehydratase
LESAEVRKENSVLKYQIECLGKKIMEGDECNGNLSSLQETIEEKPCTKAEVLPRQIQEDSSDDLEQLKRNLELAYVDIGEFLYHIVSIAETAGIKITLHKDINTLDVVNEINRKLKENNSKLEKLVEMEKLLNDALEAGKMIERQKMSIEISEGKKDKLLRRLTSIVDDSSSATGKRRISSSFKFSTF